MRNMYLKLINLNESHSRDTICYSMGSLCSSAASMIILLIVTRIMGTETSGVFSLAWSASQLMLTIGWFNTRQYQVSDVNEQIGFYEYCVAKTISSIIMVSVGLFYTSLYNYDSRTKMITMLLCVFMVSDVFADFFSGFFQHCNKLYIGGISYAARNIGYIIVFTATLLITNNLEITIISVIIFVAIWLVMFDVQLARLIPKKNKSLKGRNIAKLYIDCFPLFIGSFVTSFIMNIPKNAINKYMEYSTQASYNILFMPTSVINLFNMFLCVPFYGKLATLWNENERDEFLKILFKIIGLIIMMTVVVLIGGALLGIPLLSWLYGVNLYSYKSSFVTLLIGGGFYGFITLLTYVITVFRKQQFIVYVYAVCAVLAQIVVGNLVLSAGMFGAAMAYTMTLGVICVCLLAYIMIYLKRSKSGGEE